MSRPGISESVVEQAALAWLESLGYRILYGPDVAPGEAVSERAGYGQVVLIDRLRDAVDRLNPDAARGAQEEALRQALRTESASLVLNNRELHRMLADGVEVEVPASDGRLRGERVYLVDFENPENNDWLVVNQFTVVEGQINRRPDIVVFVNGLPLAVIELKDPTDEQATLRAAYNQLQTYKHDIPSLFTYNEILLIADGTEARVGSLTAPWERFSVWRTIEGEEVAPVTTSQLEVAIKGIFEKSRLLEFIRYFVVFEGDGDMPVKKIAAYHQFHATRHAVETTLEASDAAGDQRAGVVWHTQGSGKSLTMVFYAGKIISQPEMSNPTLVVITDRNDLDDQLYGTFSRCQDLLRQTPVQAEDRANLRELLKVAAGGVVFTTIQKFMPDEKGDKYPELSDRRNIVVIADEAHRSQYDFIDGYAAHMRDALPNASFIGFTGTPIELADRNTRAVFGDHISIYDIKRAVEDEFTVPIYYESRLARIELDETERPHIDPDFEEVTEQEETSRKEQLKTKWAALEKVVGAEKRVALIAQDLTEHWENRLETIDGKAMIVCMSRRICVDLYNAIVAIRPDWHGEEDTEGRIKVIMTGDATDPVEWQQHIRNKSRREALANRFKNEDDHFQIAIVRDMWLTGFDVPSLHTMYVDKPMRGHTLMQAIARVNRVFRDKPGGLVVDYIGLAECLREAMANYTKSGGGGEPMIHQEDAVKAVHEYYEICQDLFHGFDYSDFVSGRPEQRVSILPAAQEHVLLQDNGKDRLFDAVAALTKAFALAVPHQDVLDIRDDVAFFQAVKAALSKTSVTRERPEEELDYAIRQIVSRAIAADEEVIDIFRAAGLQRPDISILSDEFLAEVRDLPQKNLAAELLRKLLNHGIKELSRTNLVRSRSFAEMLEQTIQRYENRAIETVQVIEELIALAQEMRAADSRGEDLGLSQEELAFYDALAANESAVDVLGDEVLRYMAQELTRIIRNNVTIDWTVRENVRANLRRLVKRLLRRYGYPPDKQADAVKTVISQAELMSEDWSRNGTGPPKGTLA